MARINIEDSIYKDPRFLKLVADLGDVDRALGQLVRAWSLAQKWYLTPSKMIPKSEWDNHNLETVVNVRLAKIVNDFVSVSGAEKQFAWLQQRSNAGRSKKSVFAKSLKNSINGRQRSSTVDEPLYSSLSSHTLYKNNIYNSSNKFDLQSLYKKYPKKVGKSLGLKKLESVIKNQSDFDAVSQAIDNYISYLKKNGTEAKFIKHFSTFVNSWEDWIDSNAGQSEKILKEHDYSFLKD